MKKCEKLHCWLYLFFCLVLLAGCMRAPVVPPTGWVYSQTKAPLDVEVEKTKLGSKRGKSSCVTILGLVSIGDASIKEAAKNGNIQTVNHADYQYTNVLFLFQEYTTIVYGD